MRREVGRVKRRNLYSTKMIYELTMCNTGQSETRQGVSVIPV